MTTLPGRRILLAGESWIVHSIHQKGFDSFTTTSYEEGADALRRALATGGLSVDYMPAHLVPGSFPASIEAMSAYACVVLSDIGANSLLIPPDTFSASKRHPDRVKLLAEYVRTGGGLVMIGGYMSFQGIEAKARWKSTVVGDILPVSLLSGDDRVEISAGVVPRAKAGHPILDKVDGPWPAVLGYNRVTECPPGEVLATVGDDPLLAVRDVGNGRTVAFTSDCAPHWAPPEFVEWRHYDRLWRQIVAWAGRLDIASDDS
jgi:uncharacterized membrane protein